MYKLWIAEDYYFDIFCPDLKNNDITFYSEEGENDVKSMVFQVEKCDPKQNEPDYCKSDDEINDYIKDMQVQLLLVE